MKLLGKVAESAQNYLLRKKNPLIHYLMDFCCWRHKRTFKQSTNDFLELGNAYVQSFGELKAIQSKIKDSVEALHNYSYDVQAR